MEKYKQITFIEVFDINSEISKIVLKAGKEEDGKWCDKNLKTTHEIRVLKIFELPKEMTINELDVYTKLNFKDKYWTFSYWESLK